MSDFVNLNTSESRLYVFVMSAGDYYTRVSYENSVLDRCLENKKRLRITVINDRIGYVRVMLVKNE